MWALPADATTRAAARTGELTTAIGGVLTTCPLGAPEDPSSWLDLSTFALLDVESLGAPPEPVVVQEPPTEVTRGFYGGAVPPPSDELLALEEKALAATAGATAPVKAPTSAAPLKLRDALVGTLAALVRRFAPAPTTARSAPTAPPPPSIFAPLREWAIRVLMASPFALFFEKRADDYLERLTKLFEAGHLDEALRNAIPLGGELGERIRRVLSAPGPRDDLRLTTGRSHVTNVWVGTDQALNSLAVMYRRAFEALHRQGRIEEAAFVLAELLHASEQAVSFLETHGRLKAAAELAEGRNLDPELVVRQWVLARDWERAVAVARRHQVFAQAVAWLERSHPREATALRLVWAEERAMAGDWLGAVQAAWSVPSARPLCVTWVERGLAEDGLGAPALLAHALRLLPAQWGAWIDRATPWLVDDSGLHQQARLTLAVTMTSRELRGAPTSAELTMARALTRALLRDEGRGAVVETQLVKSLAALAAEAALLEEVTVLSRPAKRPAPPVHVARQASPVRGGAAVHDLAVLADGRVLVALGEGGVRLYSPALEVQAHFDAPAERLVVSDNGLRAIALALRGGLLRLSRVDLGARTATHWLDAALSCWADTFDGNAWFVADSHGASGRVLMVNPWADGLRALWHVPDLPALAIARTPRVLTVLSAVDHERFQWVLPSLRLHERHALDATIEWTGLAGVSSADGAMFLRPQEDSRSVRRWAPPAPPVALQPPSELTAEARVEASGAAVAVADFDDEAWVVRVFVREAEVAHFSFDSDRLALRLSGAQLALGDGEGRVMLFDVATREVREFRVV